MMNNGITERQADALIDELRGIKMALQNINETLQAGVGVYLGSPVVDGITTVGQCVMDLSTSFRACLNAQGDKLDVNAHNPSA